MLPLYRFESRGPVKASDGHLGLWFDKYYDGWRVIERKGGEPYWSTQASREEKASPKSEWLSALVKGFSGGNPALLREMAERIIQLVEAYSGRWRLFRTESRFVTGLGRRHPVENGFAWHPTLGVPYVPGSSIKGMIRAWARDVGVHTHLIARLFGTGRGRDGQAEEPGSMSQGSVAFLDAIPYGPPKLAVDVMTPHYANWSVEKPPGDWNSPTPITFLTTDQGTTFLFGVIPLGDVTASELDRVMDWCQAALYWAGAGAKTSVGYGRMVPDETAERKLRGIIAEREAARLKAAQEARRLSAMSPLDRELEEVRKKYPHYGDDQAYLAWLEEVVKTERWQDDPAQRLEVLLRIKAEMERKGAWRLAANSKQAQKKTFARVLKVMELIEKTQAEVRGPNGA